MGDSPEKQTIFHHYCSCNVIRLRKLGDRLLLIWILATPANKHGVLFQQQSSVAFSAVFL